MTLAFLIKVLGAEFLRVASAEFENITDLDRSLGRERRATAGTAEACLGGGDVGYHIRLIVPSRVRVEHVPPDAIGPGNEIGRIPHALIDDDGCIAHTDWRPIARFGTDGANLLDAGRNES